MCFLIYSLETLANLIPKEVVMAISGCLLTQACLEHLDLLAHRTNYRYQGYHTNHLLLSMALEACILQNMQVLKSTLMDLFVLCLLTPFPKAELQCFLGSSLEFSQEGHDVPLLPQLRQAGEVYDSAGCFYYAACWLH